MQAEYAGVDGKTCFYDAAEVVPMGVVVLLDVGGECARARPIASPGDECGADIGTAGAG
ncbi:hypothetical protein [Streptomyces roseifaciens]|uniref:hypothetical protein n=1 Tax=Streptomyces roseifaciens TaxID=1488406 RepID=UPI0013653805|nr:hypothetical protein [Streptomyces roseifaciens]